MTLDRTKDETHPSYGMVGLSRTMNGGPVRLFGSPLDDHRGTMRLRVKRAYRNHDLSRDWFFARDELIEIELSAAQFVDFITNPNQGDGVPCTLRYVRDESTGGKLERMPDPPATRTEAEQIRDTFAESIAGYVDRMKAERAEIEKLTEKLPAKSRDRLRILLDVMVQQLASNAPFVVKQFQEASARVVTAAKQEIDAFVSTVLRSAGMEALAEGRLPKALAAPPPTPRVPPKPCPQCGVDRHFYLNDPEVTGPLNSDKLCHCDVAKDPNRCRATAIAVTHRRLQRYGATVLRFWKICHGEHADVEFAMTTKDQNAVADGELHEVSFCPDDQFAYRVTKEGT